MNALPLAPEEATYGGICRNFISRDLLEASDLEDALKVPLGPHFHPLLDTIPKKENKRMCSRLRRTMCCGSKVGSLILLLLLLLSVIRSKCAC